MAFQVLLGASAFDAVAYARALTSDTTAPFTVPDTSYELFHEVVREDISRFLGGDYVVGTPVTNTSPLVTVANQQRYVCSVANGFTVEPSLITDVTYQVNQGLLNTDDWGAWQLWPFSPLYRFLMPPAYLLDNPSWLTLRSGYRDTLEALTPGFFGIARDPTTGLLAIDLYPVPLSAGTPIYVRYQSLIPYTTDVNGNAVYLTFPQAYARIFATLLYCQTVEQNIDSFARSATTTVGILTESGSSAQLTQKIMRLRNEAYQQLGASLPVAMQG